MAHPNTRTAKRLYNQYRGSFTPRVISQILQLAANGAELPEDVEEYLSGKRSETREQRNQKFFDAIENGVQFGDGMGPEWR